MEPEEPQVELYDFLYRDSSRIASYYAQIFSGRLASIEETDTLRDSTDKAGRLNIEVLSGDLKSTKENIQAQKRVIDPHDLITTDVLVGLVESGRLNEDVEAAPHGSLVLCSGTLVFADKFMLETAVTAFEVSNFKPKTAEERANQQGVKALKVLLSKVSFPSAFLLRLPNESQVAGTIKEVGMEEPISTYYFKHGTAGLPGVYMIGIKEVSSRSFELPNTNILGVAQYSADVLRSMFFPPDAIIVTPLAFFRKL